MATGQLAGTAAVDGFAFVKGLVAIVCTLLVAFQISRRSTHYEAYVLEENLGQQVEKPNCHFYL